MDQKPILSITLNPALDVAADVPELQADVKLRCGPPQFHPGGGGINVSRAVAKLGGTSRALVVTGGSTGERLQRMIADEGITLTAIDTGTETRQSFTARDATTGNQYRFMLPGTQWTQDSENLLLDALDSHLEPGAHVVISGSMPPGGDAGVIESIHDKVRAAGATLLADTSGDVLSALCARNGPPLFALRMDKEEALTTAQRKLELPQDFAAFGADLIAAGVAENVVMGMGAIGSVGVTAGERVMTGRPVLKPISAVGAGDSFVGGMTLSLARGETFGAAMASGTAAAASAVMSPGTELCSLEQVAQLRTEVTTTHL